jgi:pimeloyl-ACP methyl ester carboxylesterase
MTAHSHTQTAVSHAGAAPQPAPYVSRHVDAAGVSLHYLDYGTAGRRPMLCVHGGAASGHWFDFVAAGFSADHHVLAIDQRGHGDSAWARPPDYSYERYAADLDEVVNKLDLRDFVLVGHATYPGRAVQLVVVDSTLQMTPDRVAKLREVGTRQGRTHASREEFVARFRLRPADSSAAPEVLRHLANHGACQGADGGWRHKFDRSVYATRDPVDGLPHWNHIRIPALLVKGERSQRISPAIFAEVKSRCPQIEFAEVAGADHHVTLDNPTGFTQAVNAFLAKADKKNNF